MRTFDAKGNLLSALPPDLQYLVDQANTPAGTPDQTFSQWQKTPVGSATRPMQLPEMTVTAPRTVVSFSLLNLLKPPYVYYALAILAAGAYLSTKRKR
jgi:hypothetical protein